MCELQHVQNTNTKKKVSFIDVDLATVLIAAVMLQMIVWQVHNFNVNGCVSTLIFV